MPALWKAPLTQIVLLAAAMAFLQPLYFVAAEARQTAPAPLARLVFQYALPVTIVAWIAADAKERRSTPCFDFDSFVLATWPASLFWYCIATRGWRGLRLSLGLLLFCGVPMMFMVIVDIFRIVLGMAR